MNTTPLSAADQAEIDRRMNRMEAKDIAITGDKVVEMCFRECVKNFHTREMDKKEKECLRNCSGKYTDMMNRVYQRYQEIRTAEEE